MDAQAIATLIDLHGVLDDGTSLSFKKGIPSLVATTGGIIAHGDERVHGEVVSRARASLIGHTKRRDDLQRQTNEAAAIVTLLETALTRVEVNPPADTRALDDACFDCDGKGCAECRGTGREK